MSHRESDREDLLREATALVERVELTIPDYDKPIVIGFRPDGSASFYFGPDPVYQFNAACELRRAFIGGLLYKAERGRLVCLSRERSKAVVTLSRTELDAQKAAAIVREMRDRLDDVHAALVAGSFNMIGQAPQDADVCGRIREWLSALPSNINVARAPNVR